MAQRLGLNDMRMTGDPVVHQHGVGPSVVAVPMHRFAQLRIGPVVIAHPQLAVMPEDANFGDMLIGEDFLRNRRVWLSFNPPLIFVTPLR
jgi:hypothetical protein